MKLIYLDSFGVSLLQTFLLPHRYRTVPTETSQNVSGTITIETNASERYNLFLRLPNYLVVFNSRYLLAYYMHFSPQELVHWPVFPAFHLNGNPLKRSAVDVTFFLFLVFKKRLLHNAFG